LTVAGDDDNERTYTALEIVTEIFPATPDHLLPRRSKYRLERLDNGDLQLRGNDGRPLLTLEAVPQSGDPNHKLSCDLCRHSAGRDSMVMLRIGVPRSNGRRWRYLTACRDEVRCEARRHDDATIDRLLASL